MKPKLSLRSILGIAGTSLLAVSSVQATTYYWDNNGAPAGFGSAGGTWTNPTIDQWTLSGSGTGAPEPSVITTTLDVLNFGNGGTGLGAGTIAVSGTVNSGNMTFASGSGAILLAGGSINFAAASTITVNNASDTINSNITGAATSLTKAGAGILNLTGTNTYTGTTSLNAGKIVLNGGTVTGSGLTINGSNTGLSVLGGAVTSSWDAGNKDFTTGNGTFSNVQILVDGGGVAGSAKITNVKTLNFGRTVTNSAITLTNGGQMQVNGETRLGNPYYSTAGGANMTIGGGTATSTFTGTSTQAFYIGFGERRGANNNVVTVSSGGVLTNVGNMFVGHVNNAQNPGAGPATANRLTVTGTGTASMASLTVGFSQAAYETIANVAEVTGGGTLATTSGTNFIGRTTVGGAQSISSSNTMTVTGVGSSWTAGNQDVIVGSAVASSTSNDNILTVGAGASLTGVKNLTVGSGAGTHTGNKLVINGSASTTTVMISSGNSLSGSGTIAGDTTVAGTLAPGNSIESLGLGNLAMTNGSTFAYETSDNTASGADLVYLSGTLSLTGTVTLDLIDLGTYAWQANDKLTLISYTGILDAAHSLFSYADGNDGLLADGETFSYDGAQWVFDYNDTSGGLNFGSDQAGATSFVTMTVIPEPNTVLLGALGFLALLRRRR